MTVAKSGKLHGLPYDFWFKDARHLQYPDGIPGVPKSDAYRFSSRYFLARHVRPTRLV